MIDGGTRENERPRSSLPVCWERQTRGVGGGGKQREQREGERNVHGFPLSNSTGSEPQETGVLINQLEEKNPAGVAESEFSWRTLRPPSTDWRPEHHRAPVASALASRS